MTLSLVVPTNLQIGAVDITAARPKAVQRRLQLAVQRNVFECQERLDEVIAKFEARIADLDVSNKAAMDYWIRLNTPVAEPQDQPGGATLADPDDDDPVVIETDRESDPKTEQTGTNGRSGTTGPADDGKPLNTGPKAALFCLTFHGLSGAFAAERLGGSDIGDESDETAEDYDEDSPFYQALKQYKRSSLTRKPTSRGAKAASRDHVKKHRLLSKEPKCGQAMQDTVEDQTEALEFDKRREVLFSNARKAVADLLRSRSWQALREVTSDPTERDEIRQLTASVLLEVLVEVLDEWFEIVQERKGAPRRIVLKDPDLTAKLDRLLAEAPFDFAPQPLREAVRYELDGRANDVDGEGFQVDLIGYRRRNAFIAGFHEGAATSANRSARFETYVEAVNAQMAVAWRINRPLYEIVTTLNTAVAPSSKQDRRAVERLIRAGLSDEELENLRNWVLTSLYRPESKRRPGEYKLAGEFLDHRQAQTVLDEMVATADQAPKSRFYLCWKADFRGRIYAHTPWLTPQGSDVQRALFEFAAGRKLDENGVRALRRHGANLVNADHILKELEIKGRRVATLEERERWVERNEAKILACAAAPFCERFWREDKIKSPIQFLGFCLAYAQWKNDPESEIHLPTQIDGTCNGLQHIAGLTGDEELARAVNVLPRPDGLPSDIYTDLAQEAARIDLERLKRKQNQVALWFAYDWLAQQGSIAHFLDRDTAKAVIMTIPYGAAHTTQAEAVLRKIEGKVLDAWTRDPDPVGLTALVAWVAKNDGCKDYVARCTEGRFEKLEKEAKSLSRKGDKSALEKHWRLQVLAAYVAWTLVARLRAALEVRFPLVGVFSEWLNEKASAASGLPLTWLTPLGFPVCQNKFELTKGSITASLGKKSERLDVRRLAMTVSRSGQRNGLMPNLIHSLDSTHLAMVIVAAKAKGIYDIGTIHDCIQCHPNDSVALATIVREQFAQLYFPDASGAPATRTGWENWIDLVARMRLPEQAQNLLVVLDDPEGFMEKLLRTTAATDKGAARALDLLPALQSLSASEAYLARQVLEYAGKHYVKPERKKKDAKATEPGIKSEAKLADADEPGTKVDEAEGVANPPEGEDDDEQYFIGKSAADFGMGSALPLDKGRAMSPFFFS